MWRKPPAGPVTPSLPGCSYAAPPVHPLAALQHAPPSPGMQKLCKFLLNLLNTTKEELMLPFLQQVGDRTKGNPRQEHILQQRWGTWGLLAPPAPAEWHGRGTDPGCEPHRAQWPGRAPHRKGELGCAHAAVPSIFHPFVLVKQSRPLAWAIWLGTALQMHTDTKIIPSEAKQSRASGDAAIT